jgi:hypothetical protein
LRYTELRFADLKNAHDLFHFAVMINSAARWASGIFRRDSLRQGEARPDELLRIYDLRLTIGDLRGVLSGLLHQLWFPNKCQDDSSKVIVVFDCVLIAIGQPQPTNLSQQGQVFGLQHNNRVPFAV